MNHEAHEEHEGLKQSSEVVNCWSAPRFVFPALHRSNTPSLQCSIPSFVLFVFFVVASQLGVEAGCPNGVCQPQTAPHPAVARVAVCSSTSRSYGSGTLVFKDAGQAVVLTCAHLFRDGQGGTTVTFPDSPPLPATVLEVDTTWDLAAVAIAPPEAAAVAVAENYPQPGEPLKSSGYGPDGCYWCNQGRTLGYARTAANGTYETLQLTGTAREGDSGGPVLNSRGELVAVLWGTDGRTVAGTYCGRIRKFLARLLPSRRLPPGQLPPAAPVPLPGTTEPPTETPPPDGPLAAIRQRLDGLAAGLSDANRQGDERRQALVSRLEKIEKALALVATLRQRVDRAEAAASGTPQTSEAGQQASGFGDLLLAVLPQLLAALGWTGPPSIAAVLALRLAVGLIRRKRGKPGTARAPTRSVGRRWSGGSRNMEAGPRAVGPSLNDDYAKQLADVFALSGRSPLADATLGREYDEELRRAEASSDGTLAAWAKKLRGRVAARFYRIHDESPSPAEPAEF